MAANEGDAVAICAGAQAAGRKTVALMQNSGLGNAVSPLTSLNQIFRIPVLGFVSLRGEPGVADEPQHDLMGVITAEMLDTMKIQNAILDKDPSSAARQLADADKIISSGESFFFIVRKETFSKVILKSDKKPAAKEGLVTRGRMLEAVHNTADKDSLYIATTGFTGRELYEMGDNEHNFYMVGSLGCASSFALGLSLSRPDKKIIVLDGDGALLMRLGALAVNAAYSRGNIVHILFDNNAHESTGGQFTVSGTVDYPALARSCGYKKVISAANTESLKKALADAQAEGGLHFIYAPIQQGAPADLGRPKIKPKDVALRFSALIGGKI
jgi:phosphonopyruvate decarboxylase